MTGPRPFWQRAQDLDEEDEPFWKRSLREREQRDTGGPQLTDTDYGDELDAPKPGKSIIDHAGDAIGKLKSTAQGFDPRGAGAAVYKGLAESGYSVYEGVGAISDWVSGTDAVADPNSATRRAQTARQEMRDFYNEFGAEKYPVIEGTAAFTGTAAQYMAGGGLFRAGAGALAAGAGNTAFRTAQAGGATWSAANKARLAAQAASKFQKLANPTSFIARTAENALSGLPLTTAIAAGGPETSTLNVFGEGGRELAKNAPIRIGAEIAIDVGLGAAAAGLTGYMAKQATKRATQAAQDAASEAASTGAVPIAKPMAPTPPAAPPPIVAKPAPPPMEQPPIVAKPAAAPPPAAAPAPPVEDLPPKILTQPPPVKGIEPEIEQPKIAGGSDSPGSPPVTREPPTIEQPQNKSDGNSSESGPAATETRQEWKPRPEYHIPEQSAIDETVPKGGIRKKWGVSEEQDFSIHHEDAKTFTVVARDEQGKPIGYLRVGEAPEGKSWDVHDVEVNPAHRSKGIGSDLYRIAKTALGDEPLVSGRMALSEQGEKIARKMAAEGVVQYEGVKAAPAAAGKPEVRIEPEEAPEVAPAVQAPPRTKMEGATGRDDAAVFSSGEKVGVRYRFVPFEQVAASLNPETLERSSPELYRTGIQQREYGPQSRETILAARGRELLDPDRIVNNARQVDVGAPTVTTFGEAIAGNERLTRIKRAAKMDPAAYEDYLTALRDQAAAFGIDPADIKAGGVLVREITDPRIDQMNIDELGRLNTISDKAGTKLKSRFEEGVSRAVRLQRADKTLAHLRETLGDDQTLREYLDTSSGSKFVENLVADGVIQRSELSAYVNPKTNQLTRDGKELVENMMYGAAVGDLATLERAPAAALNKLDTSLSRIVRASTYPGFEVQDDVKAALNLLADARAYEGGKSIDDFLKQQNMFGDARPSREAIAIAHAIDGAPKKRVAEMFDEYARLSRESITQSQSADIFGNTPMSKSQIMRLIFEGEPNRTAISAALDPLHPSHDTLSAMSADLFGDMKPTSPVQEDLFGNAVAGAAVDVKGSQTWARKVLANSREQTLARAGKPSEDYMAARKVLDSGPKTAEDVAAEARAARARGETEMPEGYDDPRQKDLDFMAAPGTLTREGTERFVPIEPLRIGDTDFDLAEIRVIDEDLFNAYLREKTGVDTFAEYQALHPHKTHVQLLRRQSDGLLMHYLTGSAEGVTPEAWRALGEFEAAPQLDALRSKIPPQGGERLPDSAPYKRGKPGDKVRSPIQIMKDIQGTLENLITREKVPRGHRKSALGTYQRVSEVIRMKARNDLPVWAHELGHHMHNLLWDMDSKILKPFFPELKAVAGGISPNASRTKEGVAEFMRRWIDNPEVLPDQAPKFLAFFESTLENQHPGVYQMMLEKRAEWRAFKSASPEARVASHITTGSRPETMSIRDRISRLYSNVFRSQAAIENAFYKVGSRAQFENVQDLMFGARNSAASAQNFREHGMIDFHTGERVTESLDSILATVNDRFDSFVNYISAKRVLELHGRGIETGIRKQDAIDVVARYQGDEVMTKAHRDFVDFNNSMLRYLKDSGLMSSDLYKRILDNNQEYVPFYRMIDERQAGNAKYSLQFGELYSPVKPITGSGEMIINPVESTLKNLQHYTHLVAKKRVADALFDLAKKRGSGHLIELLGPDQKPITISKEEIAKIMERDPGFQIFADDQGMMPDQAAKAVTDNLMAEYFSIFRDTKPREPNVIFRMVKGEPQYARLDPELYKAVMGLDKEQLAMYARILAGPARLLRAGATLAFEFMVRNVGRDQIMATIKGDYNPLMDFYSGIASLVTKDEYWQALQREGLGGSLLYRGVHDIKADLDSALRAQRRGPLMEMALGPADMVRGWVDSWKLLAQGDVAGFVEKGFGAIGEAARPLEALSSTLEMGTRVGRGKREIKKFVPKGSPISREVAGRGARVAGEQTIDFSTHGDKFQNMRAISAFWGATLSGWDTLYRTLLDPKTPLKKKGAAWARATAMITVPSIGLYMVNRKNPDYWEEETWKRTLFWHVPIGKLDSGKTRFLMVPKPFELGLVLGTIPERILEWKDSGDPRGLEDGLKEFFVGGPTSLLPEPTAIMPLVENYFNKNTFTQRAIVPRGLEEMDPEQQFVASTTDLSKRLGKMLNYPPAKIDHLIFGYTAGTGRLVSEVASGISNKIGGGPEPPTGSRIDPRHPTTYPGARALFSRPPGLSGESTERFYETLADVRAARNTYNRKKKDTSPAGIREARRYYDENRERIESASRFEDEAARLTDTRAQIRDWEQDPEMSGDEKRKRIDQEAARAIDDLRRLLKRKTPANR